MNSNQIKNIILQLVQNKIHELEASHECNRFRLDSKSSRIQHCKIMEELEKYLELHYELKEYYGYHEKTHHCYEAVQEVFGDALSGLPGVDIPKTKNPKEKNRLTGKEVFF